MNTVVQNIHKDILELSDLNLQRKLWLNENNDNESISSYIEVMNRLFDDNDFDNFIDNRASEIGLKKSLIFELSRLRDMLNCYNERESDKEIIDDPKWKRVVEQAKKVIMEWNKK